MTSTNSAHDGEDAPLALFFAAPPGFEAEVAAEARALGLAPHIVPGGVAAQSDWPAVWRANLRLRVATRVLVRIGAFPAAHLAQLDKRARRLPWATFLAPDTPIRVDASCRRSRIYHSGAAAERVARAAAEAANARLVADDAETEADPADAVRILVRLEANLCTVSVDTSGELLHKRGFRRDVSAAPLRETLAAGFLRACGRRDDEPVVDPMCGSGAIVIEAAEAAAGLDPGRARSFAFERLASFDPDAWATIRAEAKPLHAAAPLTFGFDRDARAIDLSRGNAARAGVENATTFAQQPVTAMTPPTPQPGLVLTNPPYGARIGDRQRLPALYEALGRVLRERFSGWRAGVITSEAGLARTTRLPFGPPGPPIPHGGLRVRLYQTGPLP